MSRIFSTNFIDDIKEEIASFQETMYFNIRSIEIIRDPGSSLDEWIDAVLEFMEGQLDYALLLGITGLPASSYSLTTMDRGILLDSVTTFAMFYSDRCAIIMDHVKNKFQNITTAQSLGPASAWITSSGLYLYGTLEYMMKCVSECFVFTKIADKHLSMRRLQRLNNTMRQSSQVLTRRDQAIVSDAYNEYPSFDDNEENEMEGLLRSIVRRSTEKYGIVPPSVYIEDVSLLHNHPVSGGGFADVYKFSLPSGSVVAMKVLRVFGTSEDPGWRQCFQSTCSEAMLWNTFDHPRIIPLYGLADIGTGPTQRVAMVSPWMQNGDLRHFLLKNPGADRIDMVGSALKLSMIKTLEDLFFVYYSCGQLRGVIDGIEYLHGLSPPVVHGGICCANVLIDDYGKPLLGGFGLSRTEGSTHVGGSLRWQAPELLYPSKYGGNGRQTTQSDIYAFAMTCIEVFTDAVPFNGMSDAAVIMTVLNDGRPDRPPFGRGLTAEVWKFVTKCWHPAGSERPSAEDILTDLFDPEFMG